MHPTGKKQNNNRRTEEHSQGSMWIPMASLHASYPNCCCEADAHRRPIYSCTDNWHTDEVEVKCTVFCPSFNKLHIYFVGCFDRRFSAIFCVLCFLCHRFSVTCVYPTSNSKATLGVELHRKQLAAVNLWRSKYQARGLIVQLMTHFTAPPLTVTAKKVRRSDF